jgi:hypothetical protein
MAGWRMQHLTRRDVARLLASAGLTLSIGMSGSRAEPSGSQAASKPALAGHLHALGLNPTLFPGFEKRRGEAGSVLTSLDLAKGTVRQTLLNIAGGHMTCGLADGAIMCVAHHEPKSLIVNGEHEVMAELSTGPDHVFGGHAWVHQARDLIVLPQRRRQARATSDVGSVLVYDAKTYRLLDQVETGGIHPHELQSIPGTDELAITHYGDITEEHAVLEHNVIDAKLTILDARTLKPRRHYPQQEFKAMATHMRVDEAGWAYLVLTQYVSWPRRDTGSAYATAMAELERAIGRPVNFDIPQAALEERLLPLPLPLLAVHTRTGERRIVNAGDGHHLRSQSVAYSRDAEAAVAVYSHSDNLVILRRGGEPMVIPAQRLGLLSLRGVVELPGTTLIAVMGSYRDVAVYDLMKDDLVARYDTLNYQDTHLSFAA